ncbi:MAG: hypothetical protein U0524_01050 [Candidatus Saccharimonadales bacterium]
MNKFREFWSDLEEEHRRELRLTVAALVAGATMLWGTETSSQPVDESSTKRVGELAVLSVPELKAVPMVQPEMGHDRNPATP